jgi:hypothetical protein
MKTGISEAIMGSHRKYMPLYSSVYTSFFWCVYLFIMVKESVVVGKYNVNTEILVGIFVL